MGSLRTLNTACFAYSISYGQFPAALNNLRPIGSSGNASSTSADLVDSVLSSWQQERLHVCVYGWHEQPVV